MRLEPGEVAAIKAAAAYAFGADAVVRLFGSRVHDNLKGGDIDLHVEAAPDRATGRNEVRFRAAIWRDLDQSHIDVVLTARGADRRWIDDAAYREGLIL